LIKNLPHTSTLYKSEEKGRTTTKPEESNPGGRKKRNCDKDELIGKLFDIIVPILRLFLCYNK
jgi:hypothetical protein